MLRRLPLSRLHPPHGATATPSPAMLRLLPPAAAAAPMARGVVDGVNVPPSSAPSSGVGMAAVWGSGAAARGAMGCARARQRHLHHRRRLHRRRRIHHRLDLHRRRRLRRRRRQRRHGSRGVFAKHHCSQRKPRRRPRQHRRRRTGDSRRSRRGRRGVANFRHRAPAGHRRATSSAAAAWAVTAALVVTSAIDIDSAAPAAPSPPRSSFRRVAIAIAIHRRCPDRRRRPAWPSVPSRKGRRRAPRRRAGGRVIGGAPRRRRRAQTLRDGGLSTAVAWRGRR